MTFLTSSAIVLSKREDPAYRKPFFTTESIICRIFRSSLASDIKSCSLHCVCIRLRIGNNPFKDSGSSGSDSTSSDASLSVVVIMAS